MNDLITISSTVLPGSARVVGFHGSEAVSRPYEIEIFFALRGEESDALDLEAAVGAGARLSIDRAKADLPPYVFTGILAFVDLLHQVDEQALFRAVLVPHLWLLGLSEHSRIFTRKSLPDILREVLAQDGVTAVDLRLSGSYPVEEHVCQYRETDFDFVSRWMEREGIFYFFEHGDDGDTVVLCDGPTYDGDELGRPVAYHPQLSGHQSGAPAFHTFTSRHAKLPSEVRVRDYDYAKPALPLSGTAAVAPDGSGVVSRFGERFFTPGAGARLARIRAEEILARRVVFHASGTRTHLRTGHVFVLEEHPRAAFNARYLAIEARHQGNQATGNEAFRQLCGLTREDVYFVEITAIPAETQLRAESRTPWPRIYGYENGTIDGAADGEYAQIDAQGRYKVRFKFDEGEAGAGEASTWVRMMQPHGGTIEGFHFPLRKGTEIVASFLGGDPDRPVIAGVVPNTETPSPITSGNHTRNVIQTGGRNRLELEDQAGQQRITMSTPHANTYLRMGAPNDDHELIANTDGSGWLNTGEGFDLTVGLGDGRGSFVTIVQDDLDSTVQAGDHTTLVKQGHMTTHVKAGAKTTEVGGKVTEIFHAGQDATVETNKTLHVTQGGAYLVGVSNGLFVNAMSGVEFVVNDGAALPSAPPLPVYGPPAPVYGPPAPVFGPPAPVPCPPPPPPGFHVKVLKTGILIESIDSSMTLESNQAFSLASRSAGMTLTAQRDVSVSSLDAGIQITAANNIDITGEEVTLTSRSDHTWNVLGNRVEFKGANETSITAGLSIDVFAGLKASFELSAALEVGFGLAFKLSAPIEIKSKLVEWEEHATVKLDKGSLHVTSTEGKFHLSDMFLFG